MNRVIAFLKGYYLSRDEVQKLKAHYGVTKADLDYFVQLARERFDDICRGYDIHFCNLVEVYIRVARGFKMNFFDPIDAPYLWPASSVYGNDVIGAMYQQHGELCEHYGISSPADKDKTYIKAAELTRKLPADTPYSAIAEYAVKSMIENNEVEGNAEAPSFYSYPALFIESRLLTSNTNLHVKR
ncbi:MAG: hypothetical protein CMF12_01060 [Idiomarina sp.]|uniref:hypothetical protein n=1 Tax=Idiomarina sp. TaxID=1874361 RepID=UPI000C53368B|nr:hypothetical protein [Idiomarina sp.]MBT41089.1 hypothetical protein [Idiomarina sp.]